jgi:hypothetical protein
MAVLSHPMLYYLAAAALLLHTLWWGAGLALLATPRPWRRFWPVFVPICGFTLQGTVVWVGVLLDLEGTRTYAWWSQLLPLLLLATGWWRHGRLTVLAWRSQAILWLLVVVVLAVLVRPLSRSATELTTVSLGSCDAADYAAGARLMEEFARSDRSGFLGLVEVVQVHSVDNFFDYFVRLNHFTPSALVAHHSAIFGRAPHEIIGLLTAVFLAGSLPLVFWLSRVTLRLPSWAALTVALIYGLSPVTWYAVAHVAMSQLLAAQAVALFTIIGVALWRRRVRGEWGWGAAGLLMVGYGLVLGAYHFIVVVVLAPAVAYIFLQNLQQWNSVQTLRWLATMILPAVAAGIVYAERVSGLAERFLLFQEFNFGWQIQALTPEGWLGFVEAPSFGPMPTSLRWPLVFVLAGAWALTYWQSAARRSRLTVALALAVPALAGYAILQLRGWLAETHASYDAYKLLSVFYPGLLAAICSWMLLWQRQGMLRLAAYALAILVVGANVASTRTFMRHLVHAPLIVDDCLVALREIEHRPEVSSVNLRVRDMWSRLWAHVFLLRKPHYFPVATYEGRRATEMHGDWDLTNGIIAVKGGQTHGLEIDLPEPFELRTRGAEGILVDWGMGWHDLERAPRSIERWRWTEQGAELTLEHRSDRPVRYEARLQVSSLIKRRLEVWLDDRLIAAGNVGVERVSLLVEAFELPAGFSRLVLRSPQPGVVPGGADSRALLVCVFELQLVRADD